MWPFNMIKQGAPGPMGESAVSFAADNNIRKVLRQLFRFTIIATLLLFAFVLLFFHGEHKTFACLNVLAVIGAYFLTGCAIGFIFAIPKGAQGALPATPQTNGVADAGKPGDAKPQGDFKENTSLEEISDWLTKIIVGVSLTQFQGIENMVQSAATKIAGALNNPQAKEFDFTVFSYSLIIFYALLGLMIGYLWTRIDFRKILQQNKREIEEMSKALEITKEKVITVQNSLQETSQKYEDTKNELQVTAEKYEDTKTGLRDTTGKYMGAANALPLANELDDDDEQAALVRKICQEQPRGEDVIDTNKGRWGGKASSDKYKLTAQVVKDEAPYLYKVSLQISSTDNTPLECPVAFVLPEAYDRDVRVIDPEGAVSAGIDVLTFVPFTAAALVGIKSETEFVSLELDLASLPDRPEGF